MEIQQQQVSEQKLRPVELTTNEIVALSLFMGKESKNGHCLSKIATNEATEEAMASDSKQCLILHVPELNADSELYAIPVPGLSAERGEKFPNVKSILEPPTEVVIKLDLKRLQRVIQALRLITYTHDNGIQDVTVYQGKNSGPLFFTVMTNRGKATAVLATLE